ncbi:MAG: HAD-IB family hydrolase [bacterium]|nr:HAD-IB family hydrolase [bacterium]
MNLSLFDFDGTITKKDSFIDFIIYAVGLINFILGIFFLSPALLAFKLKIIPNWKAKELFLSYFFKGWNKLDFDIWVSRYSKEKLPNIIRQKALDRIQWHKMQGDKIVIVSASMESWLKEWCEKYDLELISTKLEIKNNKITGKILNKNCYGIEKVKRIREKYNLEDYDIIYAYGNSSGDKEMLGLANEKYFNWVKLDA